jgi:transcriptional regulator with XRE-family HTH domain
MPRNTDQTDKEFAIRMRKAHKNSKLRDLNQTELAKLFKVSPSAISTWFAGTRVPYENILEIARQFEVAADWLLTGREPMRPYPQNELITLAQSLMSLDEKTKRLLFFFSHLLEKKAIDHSFLEMLLNATAYSIHSVTVD